MSMRTSVNGSRQRAGKSPAPRTDGAGAHPQAVSATGPEVLRARAASPVERALSTPGTGMLKQLGERLQIAVWEWLVSEVAALSNIPQQQKPAVDEDWVKPIPAGRRYPGLGDTRLIFSEVTPPSERHDLMETAAIRAVLWLKEWYAMGNSLLQPYTSEGAPYPDRFAKYQPRPTTPEDFETADPLAGVARRGPFSVQTMRTGQDEFVLDMSGLESLMPRAPFIPVGGIARFRRSPADNQRLETVEIAFQGAITRPGDPGWTLAEKRLLTALNSYTTFVEHLVYLHIATAGVWSIVARMAFSTRHPLRILWQPFSQETNRVNNYNIDGLILTKNSNVPLYSGYSLETASTLIRRAAADFDVSTMDPELRASRQGQLDDPTFPTVQSAVEVYRIYRRFMSEWCQHYLKTIDLETRIFCEELDYRVPNGVRRLLGIQDWSELTPEHVAHLLALGAFACSVGHHVVNDLTRNYMMAFHMMPPALTADGHSTLGVVLEKQGSIFSAGIQRYLLISQPPMPDAEGERLWNRFQDELKAYDARVEAADEAAYRIHPTRVSSSIHA